MQGDVFDYTREESDVRPHLIFVDLEKVCGLAAHPDKFQRWFHDGVLRAGDGLLITSYLGRNPGYEHVLRPYENEFRVLGVSGERQRIWWYRRAHPAFALHRGLYAAGLDSSIRVRSVGSIVYMDSSSMGLYGFAIEPGRTILRELAAEGPYLRIKKTRPRFEFIQTPVNPVSVEE